MATKDQDYQSGFYWVSNHNYGWTCPKCLQVYSPATLRCFRCGPDGERLLYPSPGDTTVWPDSEVSITYVCGEEA